MVNKKQRKEESYTEWRGNLTQHYNHKAEKQVIFMDMIKKHLNILTIHLDFVSLLSSISKIIFLNTTDTTECIKNHIVKIVLRENTRWWRRCLNNVFNNQNIHSDTKTVKQNNNGNEPDSMTNLKSFDVVKYLQIP